KYRFQNSDFLFKKPEVINEISFEQKSLVKNHLLFCGDAAGMITPLCGNGMAMAARSALLLSETINQFREFHQPAVRLQLEQNYEKRWKKQFSFQLRTGRTLQKFMMNRAVADAAVGFLNKVPAASKFIISLTHGKPF